MNGKLLTQLQTTNWEKQLGKANDFFSTPDYTQSAKNTNRYRYIFGFLEQNLAKKISVYVRKSNDLRQLTKVSAAEGLWPKK